MTGNDVQSHGESREEFGCGGNEDVAMDVWSRKVGQNKEREN